MDCLQTPAIFSRSSPCMKWPLDRVGLGIMCAQHHRRLLSNRFVTLKSRCPGSLDALSPHPAVSVPMDSFMLGISPLSPQDRRPLCFLVSYLRCSPPGHVCHSFPSFGFCSLRGIFIKKRALLLGLKNPRLQPCSHLDSSPPPKGKQSELV